MKIFHNFLLHFFPAIIVCFLYLDKGHCELLTSSNLDLVIVALQRDVKFMFERPEQMNIDALFGLTLAQVHVAAVLQHKNFILLEEKNRRMLREILLMCEIARHDGKNLVTASGLETMIRPEIWNRTIFWKRGLFGKKPLASQGLLRPITSAVLNQGTPSESESLRCFIDLMGRDKNSNCNISKNCSDMLVKKDFPRGYPLTHRLLYVQVATSLGCKEQTKLRLPEMKKNFCNLIFRNLIDIKILNFPSFSRDLVMEQIALCGMEGYLEFVNQRHAKLITGWSNSHGCFSAFGFEEAEKKNLHKRSASMMDYGCDNHASGVAAASLSLIIRSFVENVIAGSV